ncbi:hypothetical protein Q5752_001956 [Cryptotrichosporon argae]
MSAEPAEAPPASSRISRIELVSSVATMTASPPTPAAATEPETEPEPATAPRAPDIYDKFTPAQKNRIVFAISVAALLGPVASSAFLPSITYMAADLHTTAAVIDYTVAVFILTIGLAPVVWSTLSGFYGRRPVYLVSLPVMVVASIGVAVSRNVTELIVTRVLQGIGSSAVLSVGAGTIGDIYRPTERANAMSWFYSGVLLGPALAPVIAGVFTEYTPATWRATQYFLAGLAVFAVAIIAAVLPETSHPPLPHATAKREAGKTFVWYWFNPLKSLVLLRWPNVFAMTIASSCMMLQQYCVVVPLTTIFKSRYNITNEAILGCLYLTLGGGNIVGSRFAGPYADRTVRKWIVKRGYRRPEDRLRAAVWGAGFLSPVSTLAYGWILQTGRGGMAPALVMLVVNGFGLMVSLAPMNTYLVDAMQARSAEVIAVNNCVRYVFSAAASAFVLPMADAVGFGWTLTFAAGCIWLCFALILGLIGYGERWRLWADAKWGPEESVVDDPGQEVEDEVGQLERPDEEKAIEGKAEEGRRDSDLGEMARPQLARSRSALPSVGQVLQRTTSLHAASIHGGG